MVKKKSGSIIFISSTSGLDSNYGRSAYSASKNVTGFATKMAETSAKQRLAKDTANKIVIDLLMLGEEI